MTNKIYYSIITPSLNQGKYIKQCIQSVINQHYPYFEHIIIDGGSTDNTHQILKKYDHLKVFIGQDKNHIEAVNKGIQKAKGNIISILNADDYYELETFWTVKKNFNKTTKVLVGNCKVVNKNGKFIRKSIPITKLDKLVQFWKYEFPLNPSSYFYRKEIHKNIGFYNEKAGPPYDYEFILKLASNYNFDYINKYFGNWRYYKGTITYNNSRNAFSMFRTISKKFVKNPFTKRFYIYHFSYYFYCLYPKLILFYSFLRKKIALRTRLKKLVFNFIHQFGL